MINKKQLIEDAKNFDPNQQWIVLYQNDMQIAVIDTPQELTCIRDAGLFEITSEDKSFRIFADRYELIGY